MEIKRSSKRRIKAAIKLTLSFLLIFCFGFIGELATAFNLGFLAIIPMETSGIIGIVTAPLIHGGLSSLLINIIPLTILGFLFFLYYKKDAAGMLLAIWLTTGLCIWLIGKPMFYAGSGSIIYAMGAFLFMAGCLTQRTILIAVPLVVILIYAGLTFASNLASSLEVWEVPFSGIFSGVIWAFAFKKAIKDVIVF